MTSIPSDGSAFFAAAFFVDGIRFVTLRSHPDNGVEDDGDARPVQAFLQQCTAKCGLAMQLSDFNARSMPRGLRSV
ncbi:hypothetical protein [Paramesorhizobium deserti]|uniref:hypothetical protein n=1 Tax=Paramesorhizobium deserti TaxID=1494590 RepID=UPI00191059B4|nr:hypothetical protein [Paramesorhizobium deserti]